MVKYYNIHGEYIARHDSGIDTNFVITKSPQKVSFEKILARVFFLQYLRVHAVYKLYVSPFRWRSATHLLVMGIISAVISCISYRCKKISG